MLKFKTDAVRLVKGGQVVAVTAKVLGVLKQILERGTRVGKESVRRMMREHGIKATQLHC